MAIDDLITLLNIALGNAKPSACLNGIPSGADVDIALLVQAVNHAWVSVPAEGTLAVNSQIAAVPPLV